jgi:hypothetical protein
MTKNALKKRVTWEFQSQSPQETIIKVNRGSLPSSDISSLSSTLNDEETPEELWSQPSAVG